MHLARDFHLVVTQQLQETRAWFILKVHLERSKHNSSGTKAGSGREEVQTYLEEVPNVLLALALTIGNLHGTEFCKLTIGEGIFELVAPGNKVSLSDHLADVQGALHGGLGVGWLCVLKGD